MKVLVDKFGEEWFEGLKEYLLSKEFNDLGLAVREKNKTAVVYPDYNDIFKAFLLTPYNKVKVVILGQDPYPNGEADGLAFSVKEDPYIIKQPPSLKAIFEEIETDVYGGFKIEQDWNLERWAVQGVLLLNSILTVSAKVPKSHAYIGWEELTKNVIQALSKSDEPLVFMLWGKEARFYAKYIDKDKHLVLESGHPVTKYYETDYWSGNRHFSKCNEFLSKINKQTIVW